MEPFFYCGEIKSNNYGKNGIGGKSKDDDVLWLGHNRCNDCHYSLLSDI